MINGVITQHNKRLPEIIYSTETSLIWGDNIGAANSHFHERYMVHFTLLRHKTADLFSIIYFQVEAAERGSRKI